VAETQVSAPADAPYFVITREFEAPRALIYKCYTTPEHMVHFWGPRGSTLSVCDIDLKVGGVWRVRWTFPDGKSWGYSSVYTAILPNAQIDYRDAPYDWEGGFDGLAEPDLVSTIALSGDDRQTIVTVTVRCRSVDDRDENIRRGFAGMVDTGHDRLDEYLKTLE
jgi:uncharacterized protein YndB with AHSA1/START domain